MCVSIIPSKKKNCSKSGVNYFLSSHQFVKSNLHGFPDAYMDALPILPMHAA